MRTGPTSTALASFALVACLSAVAAAGTWSVEPSYRAMFGDTSYELETTVDVPDGPGTVEARSFLEFPVDTHVVGVSASWSAGPATTRGWTVRAGVFTNLGDPGDTMSDDDWLDGTQVSSTASDVELDVFQASVAARWRLSGSGRTELWATAGLEYQKLSFDATGYEGWVVEESGIEHEVSGTGPVMDYEVAYLTPEVGLLYVIGLSDGASLTVACSGGLALASDEADHLLRGKRSEATGTGVCLSSSVELSLTPGTLMGGHGSFDLFGTFDYLRADGDQTQTWYESDGSVPAGTKIEGIPHLFESARFAAGVRLSIRL